MTVLFVSSWLLLAVAVWGPWIYAQPAGLRVLGIDLAEYVKFVAEVRGGQITLVRETFYLPVIALSLSMSLLVHRSELQLPGIVRWLLNALAIPVALSMLPPAWTPPLLVTPEFLKQTLVIVLCLLAALLSCPLLRHLPPSVAVILVILLAIFAAVPPLIAFDRLRPSFDVIHGRPVSGGTGIWAVLIAAVLLITATVCLFLHGRLRGRTIT